MFAGAAGVDAVTNRDDGIEVIKLCRTAHLSVAFRLNYRGFLGSCCFTQFTFGMNSFQMKKNITAAGAATELPRRGSLSQRNAAQAAYRARQQALEERAMEPGERAAVQLQTDNKTGQSDNGKAGSDNADDVKYSIQVDADGKSFVQIDKDILAGVPQEDWKSVVKNTIKEMFPDGFERDGKHIDNTREGRNEFTHSKSTMHLQREGETTYADKMRMAPNLNEIVQESGNAQEEKANHKNAETFNRGQINVRMGANDYRVDVLTAVKNDGREVFMMLWELNRKK